MIPGDLESVIALSSYPGLWLDGPQSRGQRGNHMQNNLSKFTKRAGTASELADELEFIGDHGVRERAQSLSPKKRVAGPSGQSATAVPGPSRVPQSGVESTSRANIETMVAQSDLAKFRPPLQRNPTGQRPKKAPVFRAPGQPGAKDDVLRKGMSGADAKWYIRFLDEGKEPAEAKRLALERETAKRPLEQGAPKHPAAAPRLAPGKREISRETPPENRPKKQRVNDQSSSQKGPAPLSYRPSRRILPATATSSSAVPPTQVDYAEIRVTKVGIAHANFPNELLSQAAMEKIENRIAEKIHLGWKSLINMVGIHYRTGYFIVDCWDDDTVEWLTMAAQETGMELGCPIVTLMGDDLPKEVTMSVWLPKAHLMTEQMTLGTLQGSNPVDIKSWRIVKCAISGPGRILVAKIGPSEQAKIASRGLKLTFRFKRVDVHGLKGSISQEAKPEVEEEPDELMGEVVPLLEEIAGPSNSAKSAVPTVDASPMGISASTTTPGAETGGEVTAESTQAGFTEDELLLGSQPSSVGEDNEMDHDRIV